MVRNWVSECDQTRPGRGNLAGPQPTPSTSWRDRHAKCKQLGQGSLPMPRSWPRACHVQGCSARPLNHAVFSPPDYSGSGGRSGGNSYGSGGSSYNPGSHGGYGGGSGGSSSYQGKQGGPGAAGGTAWGAPGHTQAMRRGVAAWARLQW